MAKSIQTLCDTYNISQYGFLPEKCTRVLPVNFKFLKDIVNHLEENKLNNFRKLFDLLPDYHTRTHSITSLTLGEKQYMYSILCMIVHRYVWCSGVSDAKLYATIPAIIGIPFYEVSNDLGIPPVLTHAAVDLYNWHLIDETREFSLDNINTNHTMTGDPSECWFYKVMIAIEGVGGNILKRLLKYDQTNYQKILVDINNLLKQCTKLIKRMYEGCDPDFFFNNIRIYLAGSNNENLPNGITIASDPPIVLKYTGGSAAQSTLIQVFDVLFDVKHEGKFLETMREYMPASHRNYLLNILPIKNYITPNDKKIYNQCISQLGKFRQAHLGLVYKYIAKFIAPDTIGKNVNAHGSKGAGGTEPVIFCQQVINETHNSKIKKDVSYHYYISTFLVILMFCVWRYYI